MYVEPDKRHLQRNASAYPGDVCDTGSERLRVEGKEFLCVTGLNVGNGVQLSGGHAQIFTCQSLQFKEICSDVFAACERCKAELTMVRGGCKVDMSFIS